MHRTKIKKAKDKSEIGRIEDGAPLVSELCLNTEIKSPTTKIPGENTVR
jgi:hypothetical protein